MERDWEVWREKRREERKEERRKEERKNGGGEGRKVGRMAERGGERRRLGGGTEWNKLRYSEGTEQFGGERITTVLHQRIICRHRAASRSLTSCLHKDSIPFMQASTSYKPGLSLLCIM